MNEELTAANDQLNRMRRALSNCQQRNRAELIESTHLCVCIPLASQPATVAAMLRNAFPDSVASIALTILVAGVADDVTIVN